MAPPPSVSVGILVLALSAAVVAGHNITAVLDGFPEYSLYNSYLTETRVSDEIDARGTVTCLVLSNAAMSSLVKSADGNLAGIKNALRLLTLLDYFDPKKLHDLPEGSVEATTLYQATGADGDLGNINITDLAGGKVGFASAEAADGDFDATYTKGVHQIPFNLSVVEVSAPIIFSGLLDAPDAASNITALLEKAGCKRFAALLVSSGVLKEFESAQNKSGLTILAPIDNAFDAVGAPDVSSLPSANLSALLEYHALPAYSPKPSLKVATGPIKTLASGAGGKFDLTVISHGNNDVSLDTGVDTSYVSSTVLDDTPLCVLTVNRLLLPSELFTAPPVQAPAPVPVSLPPLADVLSPPEPALDATSEAPSKQSDKKDAKSSARGVTATATLAVAGAVGALSLLM